ncbi:MAG: T9SS type A sorting domain-containing protein [Candidatus Delongbacteria bacterium]|nr:T9SS type A sorting domain-containing protein [Candidatus Delongbacteria bacterium]MBN2836200.1 T9SS type A sorting domain-containing protein [Candidatus Delongbacteria bacterium]
MKTLYIKMILLLIIVFGKSIYALNPFQKIYEPVSYKVGYFIITTMDKDTSAHVLAEDVNYNLPPYGQERYPFMMHFKEGIENCIRDSVYYYNQGVDSSKFGYPYEKIIEMELPPFYYEMTKGKVTINPKNFKNPENDTGMWVIQKNSNDDDFDLYFEIDKIVDKITSIYGDDFIYCDFMAILAKIGQTYGLGGSRWCFVPTSSFKGPYLYNFAHELGHSVLNLLDRGFLGSGTEESGISNDLKIDFNSNGIFEEDERLGQFWSNTSVYDMMFHNGVMEPKYSIAGMIPFLTYDMIKINCIEENDLHIANYTNRNEYTIKAIRKDLDSHDRSSGVRWGVKIPFDVDKNHHNVQFDQNSWSPLSLDDIDEQLFFVEYRDGSSYDRCYQAYNDPEPFKGILISHIIDDEKYVVDIELANPYPEFNTDGSKYREPALFDTTEAGSELIGKFYNGQRVNDWLDDHMLNKAAKYRPEGSKNWVWDYAGYNRPYDGLWYTNSTKKDFFVADDPSRNKFTPSTRPSTESWFLRDTHIGVFIKSIEGDYADINVYRNYWSKSISKKGDTGFEKGECYFGENFTIEENGIFEIHTDGYIVENGIFTVKSGGLLRLCDNIVLTIEEGSEFIVEEGAIVEFGKNSRIEYEDNMIKTAELYQNYPNPFNPSTTIAYSLKNVSNVNIEIFDISGRRIESIKLGNQNIGKHSFKFDGKELSSGVYFYCLMANNKLVDTKKMIMIK